MSNSDCHVSALPSPMVSQRNAPATLTSAVQAAEPLRDGVHRVAGGVGIAQIDAGDNARIRERCGQRMARRASSDQRDTCAACRKHLRRRQSEIPEAAGEGDGPALQIVHRVFAPVGRYKRYDAISWIESCHQDFDDAVVRRPAARCTA